MADVLDSLLADALAWAREAEARGWLAAGAARALEGTAVATPEALFDGDARPLVAALFGGTGVGKSSLMNRLAGEAVARTSAERPTSRDVTLYAHRAMPIAELPASLPVERVRTTLHGNAAWREVLWLDMPDVDSVEIANRELVLRWLPHVDVLLYVVSPERYRDDEGWRLLLEHGARHAWLFIVNHWDRGDERQLEDFRTQLVAAGLDEPLIFRTVCGGDGAGTPEDDFEALAATLAALAERRLIERLEARGVLQRARTLRARADGLHARLGDAERVAGLAERWEAHWTGESEALAEALGWRIDARTTAADGTTDAAGSLRLSAPGGALATLAGTRRGAGTDPGDGVSGAVSPDAGGGGQDGDAARAGTRAATPRGPVAEVLDAEALERVDGAIERFAQSVVDEGTLPADVLRRALDGVRGTVAERLPRLVDDALRRSLAAPGNRWQRAAHRVAGTLAALLPIAAMGWIGWRVLDAFGRGGTDPGAYLGGDFAVNGALLLALAWLLPWYLARRLAPSRERAVERGLRAGVGRALEEVRLLVDEALARAAEERASLDAAYAALWRDASDGVDPSGEPTDENAALPAEVRRMLFDPPPPHAQRSAGVRASTHSSTDAAPVS